MKKVKLLLEELQVESFQVEPDSQGIGTVRGMEVDAGSGVHSQCFTHCAGSGCEPVESVLATHCNLDCPSWNGGCGGTLVDWTCDWDCGTTIEA
jgi:hypothetical protein